MNPAEESREDEAASIAGQAPPIADQLRGQLRLIFLSTSEAPDEEAPEAA